MGENAYVCTSYLRTRGELICNCNKYSHQQHPDFFFLSFCFFILVPPVVAGSPRLLAAISPTVLNRSCIEAVIRQYSCPPWRWLASRLRPSQLHIPWLQHNPLPLNRSDQSYYRQQPARCPLAHCFAALTPTSSWLRRSVWKWYHRRIVRYVPRDSRWVRWNGTFLGLQYPISIWESSTWNSMDLPLERLCFLVRNAAPRVGSL